MLASRTSAGGAFWTVFRSQGYFFRATAMLTITMGLCVHLCRVIFGDEQTLRYIMTATIDKILLLPMTYAAISGIAVWHRVRFTHTPMKMFFTCSLVYIAGSVPLHFYWGVIRGNVDFYFDFFPMWFSYLLFPFYGALLIMFARLRYRH
jgi:hypothetical protein